MSGDGDMCVADIKQDKKKKKKGKETETYGCEERRE